MLWIQSTIYCVSNKKSEINNNDSQIKQYKCPEQAEWEQFLWRERCSFVIVFDSKMEGKIT
jgi:hypothetical protein